ncbi:MAG: bifunctional phosphoglucose/phosphomannose isomerase [Methanomassiliicoccales archaeon]|nr:MAG: bifunctional phosphoglucose/phosphomannose isomerase [Methanomassiliicoccales archaeon]
MPSDLDDIEQMRLIDASGSAEQIAGFISNLVEASGYDIPRLRGASSVCMSGIGGSAMAAEVLHDYLISRSKIPVFINRNVDLPKWAGVDTLSLITSYSGNTQEALDVLGRSIEAGCIVCCITSGGKLLERAISAGVPHVKVPEGVQPRAALGYLLGSASSILESVGADSPVKDIRQAAENTRSSVERMSPTSPTEKNLAKKLAKRIFGSVPVIYAPKNIRSVAIRWQNQINENSKMVAFSGEIPEMNHNQMVGWLQGSKCMTCKPIFILPSKMDPTIEKMTMVTIQMFTESGLDPLVIPLHGMTHAENLIAGIVLGDHVSYYLAILNGVDPGPVPVIQEFKARIA